MHETSWGIITKKYKTLFSVFFIILLSFTSVVEIQAQNASSPVNDTKKPAAGEDSPVSQDNPLAASESSFVFSQTAVPAASDVQGTGTVWLLVRMVLVLAAVVGCIYAVVFFLKKGMIPKSSADPYLKKVSSLSLAPGKTVHVVTLGSKAYIIGAAENSVNVIGEVDDKELVDAMNLYSEPDDTLKPRDFSTLLAAFTGKKNKSAVSETSAASGMTSDGTGYAGSANVSSSVLSETERMIKSQRERLNKMNTEEFR